MFGERPMYSKTLFNRYIKTWKAPQKLNFAKGGIPLTPGDCFSPALQDALGRTNTTFIHGLDGPLREAVFEAILEREATARLLRHKEKEPVKMLTQLDILSHCWLARGDGLQWKIRCEHEEAGGWVDLIRKVFNLSRVDALATLAEMLGTQIENPLCPINQYSYTDSNSHWGLQQDIPPLLDLPHIADGPEAAKLMDVSYFRDHAEKRIGAITMYNLNGQPFCLPATAKNGEMTIGVHPPIACLMNQHLIDDHPGSIVLFFGDARSALAMEKVLGDVRDNDRRNFIVSAHLGDDLAMLPWRYFYSHDVVFIPATSKVDMARVKLYKDFITGAGANSFRVFPGFLLHSAPGVVLVQAKENLPSQEAALLRDTMFIDDIERPLHEAQRISEKSLSYEEYKAWGQLGGIFKKPNEPVSTASRSEVHTLPPADPSETPDRPQNLGEVELHHFIRPGTSVAVLGAKNAGKTQVALSICAALRKKGAFISIFRNASIVPCNVAYVDAETLPDEFQANTKQYGLDNDPGFFGLCKHDKSANNPFDTYSLMKPEFRAKLQEYLLDNGCRYVVIDNLVALLGNRVDYGADVQEVLEWIDQLQGAGICPIIIHHLADENQGKARGSKIFTFRARTIITLTGKNEILRNPDISELIKNSAHQKGLTVGLRFETCKSGAILEGMTFYAHLPFGKASWQFLEAYGLDGQKIEVPVAEEVIAHPENAQPVAAAATIHDKLKGLSPDYPEVVKFLHAGSAKRADIQKSLGWGEGKTQNRLNELIEMGIVSKHGESSSTYYTLNTEE